MQYIIIIKGNLEDGSELANKMPGLVKLKTAVYSPEYRAFVEKITGLDEGTLTDEVSYFFHVLNTNFAVTHSTQFA